MKDTIAELSKIPKPAEKKQPTPISNDTKSELSKTSQILSLNQKIPDRLTLAKELKLNGFGEMYTPSDAVKKYLDQAEEFEIAMNLPELKESAHGMSATVLASKAVIEWIDTCLGGEQPEARALADDKFFGKDEYLTDTQKLHLMARYLTEIKGS